MRRIWRIMGLGMMLAATPAMAGAPEPSSRQSASRPRDIGAGDPLRKVLLDSLRPVIERDLGQAVRFVVKTLRVQQGWAFAVVLPQTPAGRPIDFRKTRHADRLDAGVLDGGGMTYALLRLSGGKWAVKDFAVGPTDVTYAGWPDDYGAPAALFGLPDDRR